MLEALAIYALALYLSALSGNGQAPAGYVKEDPCFRCGQDWQYYSNTNLVHTETSNENLPQWQDK